MKLRYEGPRDSVGVAGYGEHAKGQVVDYPDDFVAELLATSVRQRFTAVDGGVLATSDHAPDKMTVAQLKALLGKLSIDYPARAKKPDLVALVEAHTAAPDEV